jgi:hypothetical protein
MESLNKYSIAFVEIILKNKLFSIVFFLFGSAVYLISTCVTETDCINIMMKSIFAMSESNEEALS